MAGLFGIVIALPSLRVKGPSLAMVTIGFGIVALLFNSFLAAHVEAEVASSSKVSAAGPPSRAAPATMPTGSHNIQRSR